MSLLWWRLGDSCLARSRITAVPCFASWTLSNRKSTPASAHSRNSFKMYFVHWELLIKPSPHKIKNRITDVIRFFMVGVKFQKSNFLHWIKTLVNSIKEDKNLILLREINFFYGEYLVSQL